MIGLSHPHVRTRSEFQRCHRVQRLLDPNWCVAFFLPKDSQVQQTAPLESDKPVNVAPASLPEAQKATESCRTNHLRPHDFSRAKDPIPLPAEKPRLSDGHTVKKNLSLLNCVRGSLPKEVPVPLSHSMNGKNKQWEPFLAEEFAHQFHESVLQSTQKALQKHKGKDDVGH